MGIQERKNILVVTLSNIGDVILTTPVLTSLGSVFPHARFTVVVGPKAAGLLEGSRFIDRLLVYDKRAGWSHKLKLLRALREEFYEYVVDLRNSAIPFLVRAERRSSVFRFHRATSARERHLEVLQRMRLNGGEPEPFDFFSKQDEASLIQKLEQRGVLLSNDWIVVAPGAGSEEKRWEVEGFCEVSKRLLETARFNVFAVGDHQEVSLCEQLSQVDSRQAFNLAGEMTLRELAALIAGARLVLTNDSACMHLGHELHRPVVAVFGPTDPEKYGRENEIWRILRPAPPSGLEALSSEKVFRACQELLNGTYLTGKI